jgi:hypothetical protein
MVRAAGFQRRGSGKGDRPRMQRLSRGSLQRCIIFLIHSSLWVAVVTMPRYPQIRANLSSATAVRLRSDGICWWKQYLKHVIAPCPSSVVFGTGSCTNWLCNEAHNSRELIPSSFQELHHVHDPFHALSDMWFECCRILELPSRLPAAAAVLHCRGSAIQPPLNSNSPVIVPDGASFRLEHCQLPCISEQPESWTGTVCSELLGVSQPAELQHGMFCVSNTATLSIQDCSFSCNVTVCITSA